MSPDLAKALHGPRLPEAFTQVTALDLLASLGLGLLLAALLMTLLGPILSRRKPAPSLRGRLAQGAAQPEAERMLTLARLLAERGGTLPEAQRQALYSGKGADPAALEALIRRARRRR